MEDLRSRYAGRTTIREIPERISPLAYHLLIMTKRSRTRRPSTVPVASRDRENAERAARRKQRGRAIAFPKQDMASVVILIAVLILSLIHI